MAQYQKVPTTEDRRSSADAPTRVSMISRLTAPLAMAYAAILHADENVLATEPPVMTATAGDVDAEKQSEAAEVQWRQWRQKFRGQIPTAVAGADQFAEMVRDLRFRVSEAATLELPLSFIVQETSDGRLSVNEERLAPLVRHSHLSREEILKLATAAHQAVHDIELQEKRLLDLERSQESLTPIMENYKRLGRGIDYQHGVIRDAEAEQSKLDPTLKELCELEALHVAKSRGGSHDAGRFKQLSRRIGLHSAAEVSEARCDLERMRARHEGPITKARQAIVELTTEREQIAEAAFHEACERYDSIEKYTATIEETSARTSKLARETSTIRNKTFGDLVKVGEREALQFELAKVETSLTRREYTTFTTLGNTSTAFIFDRDRRNGPVLSIATNEPNTTIKATEQGENVLLTLGQPAPFHLRVINPEQTVRNYLDNNEEVAFDDKGTVNALDPLHDLNGPKIVLHLCPGSRFDLTGVKSSRRDITCEGSGSIILGARGQTPPDGRTPRIEIQTNRMPEPLVLSIPSNQGLDERHISYDSFGIKLSLQADVTIATKTSRFGSLFDKPGADVDIQVRGTKGDVIVPVVRDGRPVFDDPRKVLARINAVE